MFVLLLLPVSSWLENAEFFNQMSLLSKEKSYQQKQSVSILQNAFMEIIWKLKKKYYNLNYPASLAHIYTFHGQSEITAVFILT